ncbi:MAG: hypothetical protein IJH20_00515 [Bacilli bacterium]|nr:hypothetical protein [Bacilli bacterium]
MTTKGNMGHKKGKYRYPNYTKEQLRQLGSIAKIARADFIDSLHLSNEQRSVVKKYKLKYKK